MRIALSDLGLELVTISRAQVFIKQDVRLSWWRSAAEGRHEWKRSEVSELKRGTATAAAPDLADLRTDRVTTADFKAFQQQLRQEVAEVMQQLKAEMTGSINSRVDMLSSISTALQNVAAKPVDSKPYRISDLIPLHWWVQAWSNQGDMIFTSVLRVDKFGCTAIAADCPEAEFRLIEASLYQVLHRTTATEPLRIMQQTMA